MSEQESSEQTTLDMPFLDHLEELRRRLIKCILAVIILAGGAFYFADQLFRWIQIPLDGVPLHNMQVTGTFYAYLKMSIFAGVIGALPVIFYQLWRFISPGLYRRERLMIIPIVAISTLLFLLGGSFCFLIVLPTSLQFLLGFADELVTNLITIDSYIGFASLLIIAFGFGFQLPIVAYFLAKMGLVSHRVLMKGRSYAVVAILISAAIITPPDVFTQLLLAIPLYILYEISILVVYLVNPTPKEPESGSGDSD